MTWTWNRYISDVRSMLTVLIVLFVFTFVAAVADPTIKWDLAIAVAADVTFYFGVIPMGFVMAYLSYDYRKAQLAQQEVADTL